MSAGGDWWVLLHGTPLTPAAWDEVATRLRPHGHVLCPVATPSGDAGDVDRRRA